MTHKQSLLVYELPLDLSRHRCWHDNLLRSGYIHDFFHAQLLGYTKYKTLKGLLYINPSYFLLYQENLECKHYYLDSRTHGISSIVPVTRSSDGSPKGVVIFSVFLLHNSGILQNPDPPIMPTFKFRQIKCFIAMNDKTSSLIALGIIKKWHQHI